MRQQYHFRPGPNGLQAWDVTGLIARARSLDPKKIPLSQIHELDEDFWFAPTNQRPSCRSVAAHMRLVQAADLRFPILLCSEGRVMDGMHRATKALLHNKPTILAVQFQPTPAPDHIGVAPEDLSY